MEWITYQGFWKDGFENAYGRCISRSKFFFEWLHSIQEKESKLLKSEVEQVEKDAGIKRFEKFGEFNVIYSLANGDITKYDLVFNSSYNDAFLTLWRKVEESKFQKKLNNLISKKWD